MSKLAFICEDNIKSLFLAFGIDAFVPKNKEETKVILEDIVKKDYSVIYILEKFAYNFLDTIEVIRKEFTISIVIISDHISNLNIGLELIKRSTIDAIGTDVIAQDLNGEK